MSAAMCLWRTCGAGERMVFGPATEASCHVQLQLLRDVGFDYRMRPATEGTVPQPWGPERVWTLEDTLGGFTLPVFFDSLEQAEAWCFRERHTSPYLVAFELRRVEELR